MARTAKWVVFRKRKVEEQRLAIQSRTRRAIQEDGDNNVAWRVRHATSFTIVATPHHLHLTVNPLCIGNMTGKPLLHKQCFRLV